MQARSVTVIIVNFNARNTLPRCLETLRAQFLQPTRVIVIDNASTDGSIEIVKQLFPEYEYVCLKENTGFAAANNQAIALCDSEFVALLNPDAFPEPAWLYELLNAAMQNPESASFGSCQLMVGDADVLDGIEDVCHISGLVWRGGYGRARNDDDRKAREIFSPCAAAALYRRQAVQAVGAFDEDFFCYVEDVDLGFRLRLSGWQSWYVPTAVVRHVGAATTGDAHSNFAVYHGHRNLVWMYFKNMPSVLFWLFLPLHFGMNIVSVAWFILRGQPRTILGAKWDAIRGLRRAWQKRSVVQSYRILPAKALLIMLNKTLIAPRRHSSASTFI
jgi:GT2 family glycosyltransferase